MSSQQTLSPTRQQSRYRILEAAVTTFANKGFQATTIDDIAQAAGLSRRTLYHHFKTKQDILAAASAEQAHCFLEELAQAIQPEDDMIDFFIRCLCYVIEHAPQSRFFMLQMAAGIATESAAVYFSHPQLTESWIQFFKQPYLTARQKQQINPDISLENLANWFGRLAVSYLQQRSPQDSMAHIRHMLQLFTEPALRANTP